MTSPVTIFHLDADEGITEAVRRVSRSEGFEFRPCANVAEFLSSFVPDSPGCLVCDLGGLDLLEKRREVGLHNPFVFLTARGTISQCVRALRAGAFDFLEYPCPEVNLRDVLQRAVQADAALRAERDRHEQVCRRLATLTPREREVLDQVISGTLNKVICAKLKISRTVLDNERQSILRKLDVTCLSDMFRLMLTHSPPTSRS